MTEDEITSLIDRMTVAEQVLLLSGASVWDTPAVPRLGLPAVRMTDGPNGARGTGSLVGGEPSAAFPVGIALGATWNVDLVTEIGVALGREALGKGAQVLLGPTVNLQRTAINGRNFECHSEDPHLAAELAVAYVTGVQSQGVAAAIKHFVANEIETDRMRVSSDVDERTLRELYLRPFEAAVKRAGVWMVMAAYNAVNGTSASANRPLLTDVLRAEWGFDGVVVSDWYGTYDCVPATEAGTDLEMPGPPVHRGPALLAAVENGAVDPAIVRESARRMVRLIGRVTARGAPDFNAKSADRPEDRALIRRAGVESCVLLTNDGILPLSPGAPQTIAVLGPNAATARIMGGGSAQLTARYAVSPLDGLREAADTSTRINHEVGCENWRLHPVVRGAVLLEILGEAGGTVLDSRTLDTAESMWFEGMDKFAAGGGLRARLTTTVRVDSDDDYSFGMVSTGAATLSLDGAVLARVDPDQRKGTNYFGEGGNEVVATASLQAGRDYTVVVDFLDARHDKTIQLSAVRLGLTRRLGDADMDRAVALAAQCDTALLFVGANEEWDTEGLDRDGIALPGRQDELIRRVAAVNPRTVVVLQSGHPLAMPWAGDVAAILQGWYPGQECGHALADVLFGAASPGGRLPQSIFHHAADYPQGDDRDHPTGRVRYDEGLAIGYRRPIAPRFAFGHGLTYTRFDYGDITASAASFAAGHAPTVSVPVTNVGTTAAAEVVQLYVQDTTASVPRPDIELKAFAKVMIPAGETRIVTFELGMRDFAFFDPAQRAWIAEAGEFTLIAAASAIDHRRSVIVTLTDEWREPVSGE